MSTNQTALIRRKIRYLSVGDVLTPESFPHVNRNTVNKILTRLVEEGTLARLKRGRYSPCKNTRFGKAKATPLQVLNQEIAHNDDKCFGGLFLFNQLGLTTQVPTTIEILNNQSSYLSNIGNTRIRYVRIRPKITRSRKDAIQLLEVIKEIVNIPDGDISKTILWLNDRLQNGEQKKIKQIVSTSEEYQPRVRAILGALLEQVSCDLSKKLKKSLNKNSFYHVGILAEYIANHQSWNLKK
jgi:predicted transcriptional regulator of viral defense system